MNILVMAGHTLSGVGTGAVGHINESSETRVFAPLLVKYLKNGGANVTYIKLDKAVTKDYLAEQVRLANNSGKYDLVIQVHFNAGSKDPDSNTTGCEVYTYDSDGKKYADRITDKVSSLLRNRGGKINQGLYWLRNTRDLAILIEVCFIDDKDDVRIYNANKDKIAKLMAEGILNKTIEESKKDGWVKYPNGWSYRENGQWVYNSWKYLNGSWFYLDAKGYAVIGWKLIDSKWYYFDSNCYMKTGWINLDNKWYYLNSDGSMATGWIKVNNKDYYLHENGVMENNHIDINGKCYHFKESGELIKNTSL